MISKINFYYLLSAIFLFAFATFIPTIYPLHADSNEIPAIEQIYLPESKSKLGYIILSTDINNENSNKKLSDFIINITGSYEDPTFLHAVQSPQIQIIPIIEGYYKISINDVEDFEIFLGERCEGILNSGEVKSCQISAEYIEEIDNLSFDNKASRSSTSLFELLSPSDILENDQKNRFEIAQIPKPSDTSKVGFLILSTKVVNNNGGNKQPSDFIINIDGTAAFPSSFKAAPSNLLQVVSLNQGQYSISVNSVPGYKANFELQCSGQIDKGQIKSCLINLDDIDTPISCTAGQHFDTTTNSCVPDTPQPPITCTAGQHFDTTTNSCVPDTPQPSQPSDGFVPFHFTAAGDFRDNTNTDENMAANNPAIVLILGDFSYNGNAEQWWSKNMDALENLNVIGALGNHDDPNDDFLNLWPLNEGKWEFIYKVGNVAFVAFDTEKNDPATIEPLLAQAQADPSVEHIIPFGHKTVFTPTPGNPLKPDADREYFDIFKKYNKIRMILGGHNHFYARMNAVPGTDFIYVTVGNGGANPHQDSGESGSPPKQYVRSNGALHCDVNGDKISCKMISNEGKVWDEFTIAPGNPPASDQDPAQAPNKVKSDQITISQQIPTMITPQIPSIIIPKIQSIE